MSTEKTGQRVYTIGLVFLSLILLGNLVRQLIKQQRFTQRLVQKQNELKLIEEKNRILKERAEQVQQPEYLAWLAREKLGLVSPNGSSLFQPTVQPDLPVEDLVLDPGRITPNWQKWWRLFFR